MSSLPLERNPSKTCPIRECVSLSTLSVQSASSSQARTHARTAYRTGNITEFNARKSFSVSGVKFLNLTLVAIVVVKCSHAMVRCSFFFVFFKKVLHSFTPILLSCGRTAPYMRTVTLDTTPTAMMRVASRRVCSARRASERTASTSSAALWNSVNLNHLDYQQPQQQRRRREVGVTDGCRASHGFIRRRWTSLATASSSSTPPPSSSAPRERRIERALAALNWNSLAGASMFEALDRRLASTPWRN